MSPASTSIPWPKAGHKTKAVMSSTTSPCSCQRSCALLTSFSTAVWASLGEYFPMRFTACICGITSHTPSEHTRMKHSPSVARCFVVNSGSWERPYRFAWKSPQDRDTARLHSSAANLEGSPSNFRTVPPAFSIRAVSSSLSGRWMFVSWVTSQSTPLLGRLAMTAMESPRWALRTRHSEGRGLSNIRTVMVVPEYVAFCFISSSCADSLQSVSTASRTLFSQLLPCWRRLAIMLPGRCSWAKCATAWPSVPWPSRTPIKRDSSRTSTKNSSWFGCSGF
mmetsp:Transcript_20985/g.49180  ORF Transcript_20985/g.49180 Transcript_20985/m.49180 type:complete len:279 (+) Transcript_20985:140-976(+)